MKFTEVEANEIRKVLEGLLKIPDGERAKFVGVCTWLAGLGGWTGEGARTWAGEMADLFGADYIGFVDTPRLMTPRRRRFVEFLLERLPAYTRPHLPQNCPDLTQPTTEVQ